MKILLLEDDPILSDILLCHLNRHLHQTTHFSDGQSASDALSAQKFDLLILDINVPKLSGIDLIKEIRTYKDTTPAIIITAFQDTAHLKKGFENDCDDYIKKPFEFEELLIRIKAHLTKKSPMLHYGALQYDLVSKRLFVEGKEVDLGYVDKEIFDLLARNMKQLIYKEQFFDVMEKPSDLALRVHITKLKKRLGLHVSNVKGIGYRLESV